MQAGSGFLSQHSKELLFGLGPSQRVVKVTVEWPSGGTQVFSDVPLNQRLRIEEGGEPRAEPFRTAQAAPADVAAPEPAAPPSASWLYEPFPAPDFSLPDLRGEQRSLSALRGRPAVVLLWASAAPASRAALLALARGAGALAQAGVGCLAVALDAPEDLPKVRAAAAGVTTVPVARRPARRSGRSFAILYRHLFMNRQDLRLPTAFLLDAEGRVVKVYREPRGRLRDPGGRAEDRGRSCRASRARPAVRGNLLRRRRACATTFPTARSCSSRASRLRRSSAFERAAQGNPSASTLYRLGTLFVKSGQSAKARAAFERALAMKPDLSEASNDLGALLAQSGDLPGAIERFRAALASTPDYPTRSTTWATRSSRRAGSRRPASSTRRPWSSSPIFPRP